MSPAIVPYGEPPTILQGLVDRLEHSSLLRVHIAGLIRRDGEKRGVEGSHASLYEVSESLAESVCHKGQLLKQARRMASLRVCVRTLPLLSPSGCQKASALYLSAGTFVRADRPARRDS